MPAPKRKRKRKPRYFVGGFCYDCETTWVDMSEVHCTQCHAHFTSDRGFDRHLSGLFDSGPCRDPAEVVDRNGNQVYEVFELIEREFGSAWRLRLGGGVHPFARQDIRRGRRSKS